MKAFRRERLFTGSLLLGISAVIALMIASIFVTRNTSDEQREATARVLHAQDVLGHVDEIRALVSEAEAALRGFILSNDADYLEPFTAAARAIESRIDDLEKLTAGSPPQLARAQRLRGLTRERLKQMDEVLLISQERGLMAARQVLLTSQGRGPTAAIQAVVLALKSTENERLAKHLRTAEVGYERSRSLNLFAGALGLLALGAFVYLVDKTLRARESAAEEIARQRETLRVTLASIGDGVITTDTLGRVVFLNAEAERLTGWETAEAAGKRLERIFHIVHEDTRQAVDNPAASALRDGVVVGLAHCTLLIGRDGVERPIDDIAAPIRDSQGKVAGVVLVFRDVTEDRAATHQLRQLARELSEADRRKNEFLAMLAHEIRNPLAAIRNSAAALKLAVGDARAVGAAQGAIDRQMEHLVRLIEDLLDVARISRGKLELRRTRMDLRLALEQALEVSRPLCRDNEQALEVEIPPTPLYVHGDSVRITQAIANLLNNACKFTPRGGWIQVSVGVEDHHAIVRIRDDGIGIEPEHLPRLFDMFSQIDTSLERTQGGLGIGLNLVKQLVEMHGGRVEVRSDGIGTGSEFIVHFPVAGEDEVGLGDVAAQPAAQVQGGSAQAAMDVAVPPAAPEKGRRILVVDDNVDSADSLVMLLRLLGHEAEVARDGVEAVETALRTRPEVVLLDIGLPRMNGFEAARRIRLAPNGDAMKLIAVTGWGQDEDRDLSRSAGFDEHLVKPVDIERLATLLKDLPVALSAG